MATENLISALEYLNAPVDLDDQNSRIIIQKIAYLLKVLGFGIEFQFVRKSRGPYSDHLDIEMQSQRNWYEVYPSSYELTDSDKAILDRIRTILPITVDRLEGATTAAFLMVDEGRSDELDVISQFKQWKESFTEAQVIKSLNDAKNLLHNREMSPELRAELEAWQNIGLESISNFDR